MTVLSNTNWYYVDIEERRYVFNTGEKLWYNGGLVNGVSPDGIRMVLVQQTVDPVTLYRDLTDTLFDFYDFYSDEEVDIVAAHIIHSYILGMFGKTFYLLLDGEKGTGKSSLQNVMALLQMNGAFCGKSSTASIVRKVNSLMANINLDELDKIDPKDLQVLLGVMNTGLYRNGTYEITDMNAKSSENQIKVYRTFSTKTFSSNKPLYHESFVSRCIVINTIRNRRPIKDIHTRTDEDDQHFQNLRDRLFAFCMMNAQTFQKAVQKQQSELSKKGIYGGRSDIYAIVCGVLEVMQADIVPVLNYLTEKDEMQTEDDEEKDRLYHVLRFFCEKLVDGKKSISATNEEVTEYARDALGFEPGEQYAPTRSSIGILLKRSKIISKKSEKRKDTTGTRGGKGQFYYEIDAEKIKDIIRRNDYKDLIERIDRLSQKDITTSPEEEETLLQSLSEDCRKYPNPFTDRQ